VPGSADLRWGWRHGQYICMDVSVHRDGGHLPASAARAMGSLRVGQQCLDTVHSGTVARAHCRHDQQAAEDRRAEGTLGRVGIPQLHSLLGMGPFLSEPATGRSLYPHDLRKRESNQSQVQTDGGAGRRADRVRPTWRVRLPSESLRGRLIRRHLKCDEESSLYSPFPLSGDDRGLNQSDLRKPWRKAERLFVDPEMAMHQPSASSG
jgi:hypothetical protein